MMGCSCLFLTLILFFPIVSYGLNFDLVKHNGLESYLVGEIKTTQVTSPDENFSDIAERFEIGYYEMLEANPGVDPENPGEGTILIVPTQYLLPLDLAPNVIVINLAEMRLYYITTDGKKVYVFPVGIGKEDWETPLGEMTIVAKVKNPLWVVPESIYRFRLAIGDKIKKVFPPGPDNPLGGYALRLSKGSYLIHGTNTPEGVGRRSSAGCIKLYEKDIKQLYDLVSVGTRVIIINQPYKAGWYNKKLYLEAHMPLFEQRVEMDDDTKQVFDVVANSIKKNHKIVVDWAKVAKVAREHLTVPREI